MSWVSHFARLVVLNLAQRLPNEVLGHGGRKSAVNSQVPDVLQNHEHLIHEQLLATFFKLRIVHEVLLRLAQPSLVVDAFFPILVAWS